MNMEPLYNNVAMEPKMPKMVRVGSSSPHLIEGTNQWGVPDGHYLVEDFAWIPLHQWEAIQEYQRPFTEEETEIILDSIKRIGVSNVKELEADPPFNWFFMKKLMLFSFPGCAPSNSGTIHQFEGKTRKGNDWHRMVVFFAVPRIVEWSWFDAQIMWRYLKAKAWILNKLASKNAN
jgi:hypothetical protein